MSGVGNGIGKGAVAGVVWGRATIEGTEVRVGGCARGCRLQHPYRLQPPHLLLPLSIPVAGLCSVGIPGPLSLECCGMQGETLPSLSPWL